MPEFNKGETALLVKLLDAEIAKSNHAIVSAKKRAADPNYPNAGAEGVADAERKFGSRIKKYEKIIQKLGETK